MKRWEEQTKTISVRSADGRGFVIVQYTTFVETNGDRGPVVTVANDRLVLDDGRTVLRTPVEGRYEIKSFSGENIPVWEDEARSD